MLTLHRLAASGQLISVSNPRAAGCAPAVGHSSLQQPVAWDRGSCVTPDLERLIERSIRMRNEMRSAPVLENPR
jgi:hypothetical protein